MYSIEDFQKINKPESMIITQHGRRRFEERGILIGDIGNVITSGKIIEQYEDDFPFPSCLILGKSDEKNIHVVASIDSGFIYIITAYYPSADKWENDFRTRKESLT